jgi:hypothetical protein
MTRPARLPALLALHDDLLFVRAFPTSFAMQRGAAEALVDVAARIRALPASERAAADDTGLAHTTSRHTYAVQIAEWLARTFPHDTCIAWELVEDTSGIDALLRPSLSRAEEDAFDSGEVSTREWIDASRGEQSDLAYLLAQAPSGTARALWLDTWDRATIPIAWQLHDGCGSSTMLALESPTAGRGPLRRPDAAHTLADIANPLPSIRRQAPADARVLIDTARAALAARCREVFAITHANDDDVWEAELGEGVTLAIIGTRPSMRLCLESTYGYLLLSHGVPIGYGGVTPLGHQANTGINIFEPFRGSEAAYLWTAMLRAFATLFRVRRFVVNGYQIGDGNPEALQSGAFWFYYRLGFRPASRAAAALAAREAAQMADDRTYRPPLRVLKELVRHDLHLTLDGFPAELFLDEHVLVEVGTAVVDRLRAARAGSHRAAATQVVADVAAMLGARIDGWRADERAAFAMLAPVIALLPDVAEWSAAEHRALVALMRAKGGHSEVQFVHAVQQHPRLVPALAALHSAAARG